MHLEREIRSPNVEQYKVFRPDFGRLRKMSPCELCGSSGRQQAVRDCARVRRGGHRGSHFAPGRPLGPGDARAGNCDVVS